MTAHALPAPGHPLADLRHRLGETDLGWRQRQPALFAFGLLMLALMLPALLALGLDDRLLRGVPVWVKPIKFMAAVAMLAFTSAWFIGHLDDAVRRGRTVRVLVATVIATGGFEVAYITLQAALGQGSHYHVGDPLHAAMYTLMGIGAMLLTATQLVLGVLVWRHGRAQLAPAYRRAVVLGLVLTFLLGATVGAMLANLQPPTGPGLPVLGWSTVGGDLRMAHFVGVHASQVLPLLGAAVVAARLPRPGTVVVAGAVLWTLLWGWAFAAALAGRPLLG